MSFMFSKSLFNQEIGDWDVGKVKTMKGMFKDFNDSERDVFELTKIYRQVPADLINVIEYNPIDKFPFDKPNEDGFETFVTALQKNRVNVRVRRSRGKDIDAACGQLANKDNF